MGLEIYLDAFLDLTSCRDVGMAEGPVPWTAIMDYCRAYNITGDQQDDLIYHVRSMDVVYLEFRAKKLKRSNKGGKPPRIRKAHKGARGPR